MSRSDEIHIYVILVYVMDVGYISMYYMNVLKAEGLKTQFMLYIVYVSYNIKMY